MRRIPLLAIVPVILLAGCTPQSPSPTPTVTVTAPAPTPTEGAAAERTADTPIDAWDAYLVCKHAAVPMSGGLSYAANFTNTDVASFDDSDVVLRDDGLYYVYSEIVVNVDEAPEKNLGIECILGGTLGAIDYQLVSANIRIPADQRDPNRPLDTP